MNAHNLKTVIALFTKDKSSTVPVSSKAAVIKKNRIRCLTKEKRRFIYFYMVRNVNHFVVGLFSLVLGLEIRKPSNFLLTLHYETM